MAGKSPVTASEPQRVALLALSVSPERGEADRARAMLLTLAGWTSPKIAEAFGVREDTVRFWRGAFLAGGVEALKEGRAGSRSGEERSGVARGHAVARSARGRPHQLDDPSAARRDRGA